jgi:hypothetical protein
MVIIKRHERNFLNFSYFVLFCKYWLNNNPKYTNFFGSETTTRPPDQNGYNHTV